MEHIQLLSLNKERNSEIKTLAKMAIEVLEIVTRYAFVSRSLVKADVSFSCNSKSSAVFVTVSASVL